MAYNLVTRNNHNMFDMASLLQKAIRRGDEERAGYAAAELFGSYYGMLWKRILTVSAEDCWGIVTKEMIALRYTCELRNRNKKGYAKDTQYVSKAVNLLCRAKKSRDACYFACNFVLNTEVADPGTLQESFIKSCKDARDAVSDDALEIKNISGHLDEWRAQPAAEAQQLSIFDMLNDGKDREIHIEDERIPANRESFLGAILRKGIRTLDMELTGYAIHELRETNYDVIWRTLYAMARMECKGALAREVAGLKIADEYVNKTNKVDKRDEIYLCKAVMLIMYEVSGRFDELAANEIINPLMLVDWSKEQYKDIMDCTLPGNTVPEWVYDVHTLRGKKAGKTDWDMNLVEQAGLHPMQPAFFEDADWSPRYEWKWQHNLCTEKEYRAMKEYQKGRSGNPVKKIQDKYGF